VSEQEDGICADCSNQFSIPDGWEPTLICNSCAQTRVSESKDGVLPEPVARQEYRIESAEDRFSAPGDFYAAPVDAVDRSHTTTDETISNAVAPQANACPPREPTEAMSDAGESLYRTAPGTESRKGTPDPDAIWRAMYDASPAASERKP
jgi:hypothetical protein